MDRFLVGPGDAMSPKTLAAIARASSKIKSHRRFTMLTAAVEADQPEKVRADHFPGRRRHSGLSGDRPVPAPVRSRKRRPAAPRADRLRRRGHRARTRHRPVDARSHRDPGPAPARGARPRGKYSVRLDEIVVTCAPVTEPSRPSPLTRGRAEARSRRRRAGWPR